MPPAAEPGVFDLDDAIDRLRRMPAVLDALLRGIPEDWRALNEGPGTWGPIEVVGHLVHGERTDWMVRARDILERGPDVTFTPFDPAGYEPYTAGRSLEELLDTFAELRAENVDALAGLALRPEDLDRGARHPEFGAVTLREMLATWVAHDLHHIGQIVRVMAKHYGADVGPWRVYLSILTR